jgi:hypothetical protein
MAHGTSEADCREHQLVANTDAEIWRKVWEAMSRPEVLEAKINGRIAQLQAEQMAAQEDFDRTQGKLNELTLKRRQAIAWALNKIINEDDLQKQLAALDWQVAER